MYVDTLKQDDMLLISKQLMMKKIEQYYGSDNPLLACESVWSMLEKMVTFVIRLDEVQNVGRAKNVNSFEFNLRDVFRWCDLMLANQSIAEFHPEVFLDMLFIQRMRDARQQQHVLDLFNEVFQTSFVPAQFPLVHLTDHSVKIGNALVHRINSSQSTLHQPLLRGSLRYLESLLFAVENKLPCLLVGESGSGKSYSLQALSSLLNVRLHEYNMNTTTDATEILRKADPRSSNAAWALRYVASLPNVLCVLSGMSLPEHMEDNIKTFSPLKPLTDNERKTLDQALTAYRKHLAVPCTACRYCVEYCPQKIDIPSQMKRIAAELKKK